MKKIILISALIFSAESSSMNNSDHLSNERYEIDLSVIEKLHIELKQGEHGYIDAFLVIRNNEIVIEEYYEVGTSDARSYINVITDEEMPVILGEMGLDNKEIKKLLK